MNELYYGDCLDVMREMDSGLVDLIYLDPPFNSKRAYNVLFQTKAGRDAPAQVQAFDDTWHWDAKAAEEFAALHGSSPKMSDLMECLDKLVGRNDLLAYLVMMSSRLVQCHRLLKRSGSIYLHCDQTAVHYLKIVMDSIFGPQNFLNNVVWLYGLGGSSARYWPRKHDDLLFYSKAPDEQHFVAPMVPAKSQMMAGQDKKCPDFWDIPSLNNMAKERLGYPTQKPLELLQRVVSSSCPVGGVVLDPFCGCGTTVHAAEFLDRKWIGIDGRGMFPTAEKTNGQLIISVKGGQQVNPSFVREVAGTAAAEGAELGMLITLVQPSSKMREAAASHGMYIDPLTHREYPRIQVYSIEDYFRGVRPRLPALHLAYIKARSAGHEQLSLL